MFSHSKLVFFLGNLITITVLFATSVWAVVDISEIPLDTQTKAAPANIMFILDDSGSMDWEMMTGESSGTFSNYEYVFDDPGDNAYTNSNGDILTNYRRKQWKSQWFGYNKMYYDPSVTYTPWPQLTGHPWQNGVLGADPDTPRSHPYKTVNTFDLSTSYLDFALKVGTLKIPQAHYYILPKGSTTPYLVILDSDSAPKQIRYYATTISGSGSTELVTNLTSVTFPPNYTNTRSYKEERQNFANWYSFYRRRELTATAAVSNVIVQMAGVQIGISTIHDLINQSVKKIKVGSVDETNTLLTMLYSKYNSSGGTPLIWGLQDVGQYYDKDDGQDGSIGVCPYWSKSDGGECQQSFAILMTDGYYNGGGPLVNNVDGNNGVPFADNYSNTLADVAMYYWENDLSSGLANLLSPSAVDSAQYQHMVTYGVSFGVTGTLTPANYDLSAATPPTIPWPDPEENLDTAIPEKIDDLYHASVDGHGIFLSASNPKELVSSLLAIMKNIKQRIGSASSVSVNGDELYKRIDNNTYMFQSTYDTVGWVGDIKAYKVNSLTGSVPTNPAWSARTAWDSETWSTYWNTRPIVTYNGSTGVKFRIDDGAGGSFHLLTEHLAPAQETLLVGSASSTALDILNYVRGDDSKTQRSGGTFRNRRLIAGPLSQSIRLGDIVHSSPTYHNGIIYAGANDGMMHAIRAEGSAAGSELFSYVPSQVIKNLSKLTDPTYSHNYYVDLTVTIKEDVDLTPTVTTDADKTLLVGGLGEGGIGYYALDISGLSTYNNTTKLWVTSSIDEAAAAGRVLWEFPHLGSNATVSADVDDIGSSFSNPLIVKTNDPTHPWVVIFGNGYNSTDGQAVLFILNPANGNVLKKFELGPKSNNGLSTPSVTDVNGDGKVDYVYAGDLSGNMWKIDLTGKLTGTASPGTNWAVAFGANNPLFTARGPGGTTQPITSKPDVMFHPQYHGYLVAFGTGKFLGTSDFLDKSVQTVYGIWDYGDDSDDSENLGTFDSTNREVSTLTSTSTLLEQKLLLPDFTYTDPKGHKEIVRVLTDNPIKWVLQTDVAGHETDINGTGALPDLSIKVPNNAGWYFNLPNSGERIISRMMIRDGKAIFISFTPENSPCTPGGNSILHEVDAADGSRLNSATFNTNGDNYINSSDTINVTIAGKITPIFVTGIQRQGHLQTPAILKLPDSKQEIKYMSSTSGSIETVKEAAAKTGLSSWREF